MIQDRYPTEASPDFLEFYFVSTGPKGDIQKTVTYTEILVKNFYNLGFGDKDASTSVISDTAVSNNEDSKKVLATVAGTLFAFIDAYPDAYVVASGSTEARTRLYRMGITNNLETIQQAFDVFGLLNGDWKPFQKAITYDAFLVRCKKLDL